MAARRRFVDLEMLARERGYGVRREGKEGKVVFWWRNRDPSRTYSSVGIGEAWEDIILDYSSEKRPGPGSTKAQGETK